MLPVLYSFRRCPYAIRARMALAYAGVEVELREVVLRNKPAAMLQVSPKGTVPVMVLPNGTVIDESIDIMRWALAIHDPDKWRLAGAAADTLIEMNDFEFKPVLDRYKYSDRYPEFTHAEYSEQAKPFLLQLEVQLGDSEFLFGPSPGFADVALFPFIRQFAFVNKAAFDRLPFTRLQKWLAYFLGMPLFLDVMSKYPVWVEGAGSGT